MISGLLDFVIPLAVLVGGVLFAWLAGKRSGKAEQQIEQGKVDADAQKRTDAAYRGAAGNPRTVRDSLRDKTQPW